MQTLTIPGDPTVRDETTPTLVRAYTEIKCADARGQRTTPERHAFLGTVVTELRRRGVLD